MVTKRGLAKHNLVAHAFGIANDVERCAERIRLLCEAAKAHDIDEFELVEQIHAEVFGLPHELGLVDLCQKLLKLHRVEAEAAVVA